MQDSSQKDQDKVLYVCSRILDTRKSYLPNVIPSQHMTHVSAGELVPPERHHGYFSQYHIARYTRARLDRAPWSTGRSFRSAESRMLARSTRFRHRGSWLDLRWLVGWQLAPKKHRKTSRPVITVAPVLSSHYQRALVRRINLIRFSGWSKLAMLHCTNIHLQFTLSDSWKLICVIFCWKYFILNFREVNLVVMRKNMAIVFPM